MQKGGWLSATSINVFTKNVGTGWTCELISPLAHCGSLNRDNRWCMRKQCHSLEDGICFSEGLRGYIFLCDYWITIEYELQVILLLQNKKNSSIPSKENRVSSKALCCSRCFLYASPHQASGTWQTIRLKSRNGMGAILMHEQSSEECQSHTCYRFSMTRMA